jgi:hypothetical protein
VDSIDPRRAQSAIPKGKLASASPVREAPDFGRTPSQATRVVLYYRWRRSCGFGPNNVCAPCLLDLRKEKQPSRMGAEW